jgi:hypothetical protein
LLDRLAGPDWSGLRGRFLLGRQWRVSQSSTATAGWRERLWFAELAWPRSSPICGQAACARLNRRAGRQSTRGCRRSALGALVTGHSFYRVRLSGAKNHQSVGIDSSQTGGKQQDAVQFRSGRFINQRFSNSVRRQEIRFPTTMAPCLELLFPSTALLAFSPLAWRWASCSPAAEWPSPTSRLP